LHGVFKPFDCRFAASDAGNPQFDSLLTVVDDKRKNEPPVSQLSHHNRKKLKKGTIPMTTDHDHHHDHHHHDHDSQEKLPFDEKLLKILQHWPNHNEDHALNYRKWAKKAKANGKQEAGKLLEEAATLSLAVNEKFEAALAILRGK
jgi:G3E family GTPase